MNSRQRVHLALNHQAPDRIPRDLGGRAVTGMHVSSVYLLRQALNLDPPGTPVKVVEPYQMLGEIAPDLIEALEVDVVPLPAPRTMFGFPNQGWKPWTFFDGTPVLVPEAFNTQSEPTVQLCLAGIGPPEAITSIALSASLPLMMTPSIPRITSRSSRRFLMRTWHILENRRASFMNRPTKPSWQALAAQPLGILLWYRRPG